MTAFGAGRDVARGRLRGSGARVVVLAALAVTTGAALFLHRSTPLDAADVVLGALLGWCVPLVAYAAVARACLHGRLDAAVGQLARHGMSRRGAALGVVFEVLARVSMLSGALAGLAVVVAHGRATVSVLADAATSTWVGALAGAAYVAWFGVGSLVGKKGGGRSAALLLDAMLGSTSTVLALPWPRAHVRSLLGGELVHGLPEWKSTAVLYALTFIYLAVCAVRFPR